MSGHHPWSEVRDARQERLEDEFATRLREATAAAFGFWWHGDRLHYHRADRKRMRCPACYPRGYTPKLRIDGHEYRRRRLSRRRKQR